MISSASVGRLLSVTMGIFDDMENFIIDHFSVTKRHNVQQTIEIMNSSGQQRSLSGQGSSEQLTRSGSVGRSSQQLVSVTQQGQVTSEQSSSISQHVVSSSSSEQTSSRLEHSSSRSERGSTSSDAPDLQRSPPLERSTVPSSPFRERVSWGERAGTPVGISELHRSPQLEHVGISSPFRSRQRTSWVEQSNLSSSTEQKRAFSFEHVAGSPGLRRAQRNSASSEHQKTPQSEHGPINSPFRSDHQRSTPLSESLPPNSPFRSERQRSTAQSEPIPPGSPFRCECRSPQADNVKNSAISADQQQQQPPPPAAPSPKHIKRNIDVSVITYSKPKLVRLRSEPCTFSTTMADFPPRGQPQEGIGSRRRREELKRSQSFEASSPSCHEALWTGINVPSQLIITRPQLCRSKLNRKHLSLHLEGVSGDLNSLRPDPPLQFHDTHGDNIELLNNKTRARRYESFCKGICFSNRPIAINERVYVKFVETNTSWSGVLRFGFTSVNPATLRGCDLPRYACPDLTNKPGNWAKALGERYTTSNILLHFSVNRAGDVVYGVNGEEKGLFFSGVDTSRPLWAMLDIYGNTVGVEFSHANAEIEPPANASQFDASPQPSDIDLFSFSSSLSVTDTPSSPSAGPPAPLIQWHAGIPLSALQLHRLQGRNVRVSTDRTIAVRLREEYCNGFVFTARPIRCGETIVIQVLSIDRSFIGGLGFGLTACDPATVDPNSLPDDSDLLLDRLEYWVVNKDVCRNPEVGDELSFCITESGEVRYARNNQGPVTLMHVDRTLPLWAFFDIYGNIQKIKVIGTTMTPVQGRLARSQSMTYNNIPAGSGASGAGFNGAGPGLIVAMPATGHGSHSGPTSMTAHVLRSNSVPVTCLSSAMECGEGHRHNHPISLPTTPLSPNIPLEEGASDCKVCWERTINCVLYTCGHMCLCFDCAMTIRSEKGLCPICRQAIVDVIKIYRS